MTNINQIRMHRVIYVLAGIALTLASCSVQPEKLNTDQMNILFINVEDLASTAVGCYGNPMVKTPHIDKLAGEGILFSRAYCQGSMCNPSRTSFCTGLRPETTGVLSNGDKMNENLPDDATSIAEILGSKEAYLASLGKLYHYVPPAEKQMKAFNELGFCVEPTGYTGKYRHTHDTACPSRRFHYASSDPQIETELIQRHDAMKEVEKEIPHGGDGWWEKGGKKFYLLYFEMLGDSGEPEECMEDGQKSQAAAKIIKEMARENKQFFLSVGFDKPHTPSIAPKKYVDMYPPEKMVLSPVIEENDQNIPAVAKRFGAKPDLFKPDIIEEFPQLAQTPEREQQALSAYYGCASYIDAQVGVLLDALEQAGITDNTIVIFFSDHGFHLGEHGLWSKYSLFEEVIKIPLIVKVPGAKIKGVQSDRLVELVDLLPTLCDFWQIETPDNFEGLSFLPLLEEPDRAWKKAAYTTCQLNGYLANAMVTNDYKYTSWTKNGEVIHELYDRVKDPYEQRNVINQPEYEEVRKSLEELHQQGWEGALPE